MYLGIIIKDGARLALLSLTAFGEGNRLFTEFRGALSKNYVLQALTNPLDAKNLKIYKEKYHDKAKLRILFSVDNLKLVRKAKSPFCLGLTFE